MYVSQWCNNDDDDDDGDGQRTTGNCHFFPPTQLRCCTSKNLYIHYFSTSTNVQYFSTYIMWIIVDVQALHTVVSG